MNAPGFDGMPTTPEAEYLDAKCNISYFLGLPTGGVQIYGQRLVRRKARQILFRQTPHEILRLPGSTLSDEVASSTHLAPYIPQQDTAHAPILQVVDDTFPELLVPIGNRL